MVFLFQRIHDNLTVCQRIVTFLYFILFQITKRLNKRPSRNRARCLRLMKCWVAFCASCERAARSRERDLNVHCPSGKMEVSFSANFRLITHNRGGVFPLWGLLPCFQESVWKNTISPAFRPDMPSSSLSMRIMSAN